LPPLLDLLYDRIYCLMNEKACGQVRKGYLQLKYHMKEESDSEVLEAANEIKSYLQEKYRDIPKDRIVSATQSYQL
jgi:hypothetical protein